MLTVAMSAGTGASTRPPWTEPTAAVEDGAVPSAMAGAGTTGDARQQRACGLINSTEASVRNNES